MIEQRNEKRYRQDWENLRAGDYVFTECSSGLGSRGMSYDIAEEVVTITSTEIVAKDIDGKISRFSRKSREAITPPYAYYLAAFRSREEQLAIIAEKMGRKLDRNSQALQLGLECEKHKFPMAERSCPNCNRTGIVHVPPTEGGAAAHDETCVTCAGQKVVSECSMCKIEEEARARGYSPLFMRMRMHPQFQPQGGPTVLIGQQCDTEVSGKMETVGCIIAVKKLAGGACEFVVNIDEKWIGALVTQLEGRRNISIEGKGKA